MKNDTNEQEPFPQRAHKRVSDKRKIDFNINRQEAALLETWMQEGGWENISGFVKSRLFGDSGREYERLLARRDSEGKRIAIAGLVSELARKIADMEEDYVSLIGGAITDAERTDDQKSRRQAALLKKWRDDVLSSNADVLRELRLATRQLDVRQTQESRPGQTGDEGYTSSSRIEQERAQRMYEEFSRQATR